jgi:Domain of unknown function (DUF5664)
MGQTKKLVEVPISYKDKANKVSFTELSPKFLVGMAQRLNENKKEYGGKYESFNWKGSNNKDILDALERHVIDIKSILQTKKAVLSEEPLHSHLAAAAVNIMFLYENNRQGKPINNTRPKRRKGVQISTSKGDI